MSKKRTKIEFESPEEAVKLNYFKNEVEFSKDDSFGVYMAGNIEIGQIDKNTVFTNMNSGNPIIMTEIFPGYKNKETAVVESDFIFNGEEMTLTATLILK